MSPYEILGVSEDATNSEITNAYNKLMQQYSDANYRDHPLSDVALKKRKEIIAAYDSIIRSRENTKKRIANDPDFFIHRQNTDFPQVRQTLIQGNPDEALRLLLSEPDDKHNAEWFFLMGKAYTSKGWSGQAKPFFEKACQMDPHDPEFQQTIDFIENKNREYQTQEKRTSKACCYNDDTCDDCGCCEACGFLGCECCCDYICDSLG